MSSKSQKAKVKRVSSFQNGSPIFAFCLLTFTFLHLSHFLLERIELPLLFVETSQQGFLAKLITDRLSLL